MGVEGKTGRHNSHRRLPLCGNDSLVGSSVCAHAAELCRSSTDDADSGGGSWEAGGDNRCQCVKQSAEGKAETYNKHSQPYTATATPLPRIERTRLCRT